MSDKLHTFSFKDGFKRARKNNGYTQKSFAEKFKISIDTIKNWEQGRNIPEIKTLEKLCNFFHCDLDYLFGNIECKTHDIQFIHNETGLSEKAIKKLKHLWSFPSGKNSVQIIDYFIKHGDTMITSIKKMYEYKINYDKCKYALENERPPLTNDSIYEDELITKKRNLIDEQYNNAKIMYEVAPARAIGKFENLIKKMIDDFCTNGWK